MPRRFRLPVLASAALLVFAACHSGANRLPPLVTKANVALGDSLFNNGACQRCHGKAGVGAANAPALDGKKWLQLKTGGYDEIVGVITNGVAQTAIKDPSHKFAMRGRGGPANYSDAQIQALAAYVWTLSHPKK